MKAYFVFLTHLVLFLSLTTLVFAVGAYATLMLRRRRPGAGRREHAADEVPLVFRYTGEDYE
ncbi:MAG: hypothetical protein ABR570_12380 [Burkholderiales bacterium]